MRTVDINSDLGESFGNWRMGNDDVLIPEITTANVACGFHASDPVTMVQTVERCRQHGVAVGAHPGLPDLLGFGRRPMAISPDDAYAYVLYQAGALQGVLRSVGMTLHHVKPHGAMYSILRDDDELAPAAAEAIAKAMPDPVVYWPAPTDAALPNECRRRGIRVVGEIYPDLEYAPDGRLILQRAKHHTDVDQACAQVRRWFETGRVATPDGTPVEIDAESICIHGDGPNAVEVTQAVKRTIEEAGGRVGPLDAATEVTA
jgi:UPF0271 protein